ncbi:MAG TPA: hypothetical protein VIG47_14195, partial [Gemmatimonadaceae bacterium]
TPGRLPPPIDDIESYWSPIERAQASARLAMSFVGSHDTVRRELTDFISHTQLDEIIVASMIHDHAARVHSYEILAEVIAA